MSTPRLSAVFHACLAATVATVALVGTPGASAAPADGVNVIGVENEYADIIAQIGGPFVHVEAIESDPNTDPHNFEASPRVAASFANARLIVLNGAGYDDWAAKIIHAAPDAARTVIDVQRLLGLPDTTPNPHLWYAPATMPAVARAVAASLSVIQPAHAGEFANRLRAFTGSMQPVNDAIAAFKSRFAGAPIAVTEPVANELLEAAGVAIRTPFSLQAAIMNGTDPSPQDVSAQDALFSTHAVKVFVYNQQVTDALTNSFIALARKNSIPVVGVYETMPTPGFTYQTWMMAELDALRAALAGGRSTETLEPTK